MLRVDDFHRCLRLYPAKSTPSALKKGTLSRWFTSAPASINSDTTSADKFAWSIAQKIVRSISEEGVSCNNSFQGRQGRF